MDLPKVATRDEFENWLISMDDVLEEFFHEFQPGDRQKLDYSGASLDFVEAWILSTYQSIEAILESSASKRVNNAACYVGETFRKAVGGKWTIEIKNRDDVYFGLPVIVAERKSAECPLTLVTASADRRRGNYLRTVFENYRS